MDSDGVETNTEILVGIDGYARIFVQTSGNAIAWGEVLIPKNKLELAWRNYLRAGD